MEHLFFLAHLIDENIAADNEKGRKHHVLTAQFIVGNGKGHPARDGQYKGFSFKFS
jgi:hypothetical protein